MTSNSTNLLNREKALWDVGVWVLSKGVVMYDHAQFFDQDIVDFKHVCRVYMYASMTVDEKSYKF